MYTVRLQVLLKMVEVKAHEDLRAEGKLVEFYEKMGRAAFVSHQWVSNYDELIDDLMIWILCVENSSTIWGILEIFEIPSNSGRLFEGIQKLGLVWTSDSSD